MRRLCGIALAAALLLCCILTSFLSLGSSDAPFFSLSFSLQEYDCDTLMTSALTKHHVRAVDAAALREEVRAELEKEYLKHLNFK